MPDEVTYGALAVASRRRLLEVLRAAEERLDVPALAAATGLHPNTVRFHLDVLVRAGFVAQHSDERGARGRPRTMYAPAVAAGHDDGYHLLAEMLVTHFDEAGDGAAAERAGHAWARRRTPAGPAQPGVAAATRTAVALFTEMGFDPAAVRHGRGRRILLRACPFRALAEKHPGVVCTLHLGLLRGIVERASTGTADAQLTPFVQPHLCVAEIVASERERTP